MNFESHSSRIVLNTTKMYVPLLPSTGYVILNSLALQKSLQFILPQNLVPEDTPEYLVKDLLPESDVFK